MDKNSIYIVPFVGEIKIHVWLEKLMERSEIGEYNVLIRDYMKTQTKKAEKTKHK